MITCQRCNTENLDGSQYCDECGALLSVVAPAVAAHLSSAIPPHAPIDPPIIAAAVSSALPSPSSHSVPPPQDERTRTPEMSAPPQRDSSPQTFATPPSNASPFVAPQPSPSPPFTSTPISYDAGTVATDARSVTNDRHENVATDSDVATATEPSQSPDDASSLAPTAALQMPPSMIPPAASQAPETQAESAPEAFSPEMTFVAPVRKLTAPAVAEQAPPVSPAAFTDVESDDAVRSVEAERTPSTASPESSSSSAASEPFKSDASKSQETPPHFAAANSSAANVYGETKEPFADAQENLSPHGNGFPARGMSDVSYASGKLKNEGALRDEREPLASGAPSSGQASSGAYVSGANINAANGDGGNGSSSSSSDGQRSSASSSSSFAPPIPPAAPPSVPSAPSASHTIANFSRTGLLGGANAFSAKAGNQSNSQTHAKLVIQRGRAAGKEFSLNEEVTQIGRWDADGGIFPDVDLDADDVEAKVSRRHARIMRRGEQYFVEDLGSTNGTFVNRGRRLLPGDLQPLRDGDELIVGKTFLKFTVLR